MPQSPTEYPSVITVEKKNLARVAVCNTVGISVGNFFLLPTKIAKECEITDSHDSDGIIPSKIPSVILLPTVFVPYIDRINPSVKLFNGVVNKQNKKS